MRRAGYSYVEMLVVITMIGVLVALLLPAVQAAREAARRSACGNNLEQLIIAVQTYETHHGVYPPGTIDAQGPILSQPVGYHHNWISQVLPFMEQKTPYRHIDWNVGVYHANNVPVRRLEFRILRCPSSPRVGKGYSDYAGVHNSVEAPIDVDNDGVFFLNSRVRFEDLLDGSSNTIFIGEKLTFIGDLGWMSGTRSTLRNVGPPINGAGAFGPLTARSPATIPTQGPPGIDESGLAAAVTFDDNAQLDLLLGPKDNLRFALGGVSDTWKPSQRPKNVLLAVGGFASVHPGGAAFAAGDGSIRFISSSTDNKVLRHFAHRADGRLSGDEP